MPELISAQFREIEADMGTIELAELVMNALSKSVMSFKFSNFKDFKKQFKSLLADVKKTQPRYAIIIENFYKIWEHLPHDIHQTKKIGFLEKKRIIKNLSKTMKVLARKAREDESKLIENSFGIDVREKTILIYDHSHLLIKTLIKLKKAVDHFRIIVAAQDPDKTTQIIEALGNNDVAFQVVPSYMLSHLGLEIDMVFFGAVTLKNTFNFVMDPGSLNVVSQFHLMKKPIYMFITTDKFSLWKAEVRHSVHIKKSVHEHHCCKKISYEKIKFSHDRVPLKYFDYVVCEDGVFTGRKVRSVYKKKYANRQLMRKQVY
ncbi:hypothetical protein KKG71_01725 [Patescibacteria group bacterium]|nr:hypothetical protein [Patescibacteria group bacterium]